MRKNLFVEPLGLVYCIETMEGLPNGDLRANGATPGACNTTPPPPAGDGIATARVTYYGSPNTVIAACNMRELDQFAGRSGANDPSVRSFPWPDSPTLGFQLGRGQKLRARFTVPANTADTAKLIRANNYHGATTIPLRCAIVAPGGDWPGEAAERDGSYHRGVVPGGNEVLAALRLGGSSSTGYAEVLRLATYDLLCEFEDGGDPDSLPESGYVVISF